jgi:uncharacterized membrane protein YjjB (DUF3815 family)
VSLSSVAYVAVTILISCGGWAANHFLDWLLSADRTSSLLFTGAFAIGIVANTYAKIFSGNAYVVMVWSLPSHVHSMITGMLFQLPSGLANGGLLTIAANDNKGQQFESYQAGFQVALQLVAASPSGFSLPWSLSTHWEEAAGVPQDCSVSN